MTAHAGPGNVVEHLVFEVAKNISQETGDRFFRTLAEQLARLLNAGYVTIGQLTGHKTSIRTLAVYRYGESGAPRLICAT